MSRRTESWKLCLMAALWLVPGLPALAQTADTGVGIAEVSGGGLFGLGGHGNVGGSFGVATSKYIAPYIEFSYSPLSSYGYTYGDNNTGKGLFTSQLWDVNGGIKIRFPRKRSDWVPYVGLGAGLLRHSTSNYTSGFNTVATINASTNEVAGSASVGALYYVTKHVALGIEAKGYFAAHERLGRATVGVAYQFP